MASLISAHISDPKRDFAIDVVQRLQGAGYSALWAGGCVRDLLLGLVPQDYDVATNAHPEQVRQLFGLRKTVAVGASFGVILVLSPQHMGDVEVATFRVEGPYLDGRRPEHVSFATAEEDAQRRDFTINGLFYDPITHNLFDYVGGKADLDRGILRAIGAASERFREDKLRMLRAVRITARFNFLLDPATAEAVRDMASELLVVSPERISQELQKMLLHPRRALALELARELHLLLLILPELRVLFDAAGREAEGNGVWTKTLAALSSLIDPGFELTLAVLWYGLFPADDPQLDLAAAEQAAQRCTSDVQNFCRRLRLSNKEADHTAWLIAHRHALRHPEQLPVARLKRVLAHPLIRDLLALQRAVTQANGGDAAAVEFCERVLRDTPAGELAPEPLVKGHDLIAAGLRPGARFKSLLEEVYDAQLAGVVRTKVEAIQWVARLPSPRAEQTD